MENNQQNTKQQNTKQLDTKGKIQQAALELFSKKGYHAVSIRDICKEVGIKESTVYYHYKNKEDILDSLFNQVAMLTENMKNSFNDAFTQITEIDINAFCMVAVGFLEYYLLDKTVYKLISMLTIEKLTNEQADRMYRELLFDAPLLQQERVLEAMIEKKYFKKADPWFLAREYYAAIFFVFQKYFCGYEITESNKRLAEEDIIRYMSRFFTANRS